jgi:peptide chain release factor 3
VADRHGVHLPGLRRRLRQAPAAAGGRPSLGRAIQLQAFRDIATLADIDPEIAGRSLEGLELAASALPQFDLQSFREGHLSPCSSGSALRNFGVEELLDAIGAWAPSPLPRKATERTVNAGEKAVTGFIFKVQANMDPNHRDRIAFMRLCSGHFRRGMKLLNVREKRTIAVNAPILFFASSARPPTRLMPVTSSASPTTAPSASVTPSPRARR